MPLWEKVVRTTEMRLLAVFVLQTVPTMKKVTPVCPNLWSFFADLDRDRQAISGWSAGIIATQNQLHTKHLEQETSSAEIVPRFPSVKRGSRWIERDRQLSKKQSKCLIQSAGFVLQLLSSPTRFVPVFRLGIHCFGKYTLAQQSRPWEGICSPLWSKCPNSTIPFMLEIFCRKRQKETNSLREADIILKCRICVSMLGWKLQSPPRKMTTLSPSKAGLISDVWTSSDSGWLTIWYIFRITKAVRGEFCGLLEVWCELRLVMDGSHVSALAEVFPGSCEAQRCWRNSAQTPNTNLLSKSLTARFSVTSLLQRKMLSLLLWDCVVYKHPQNNRIKFGPKNVAFAITSYVMFTSCVTCSGKDVQNMNKFFAMFFAQNESELFCALFVLPRQPQLTFKLELLSHKTNPKNDAGSAQNWHISHSCSFHKEVTDQGKSSSRRQDFFFLFSQSCNDS